SLPLLDKLYREMITSPSLKIKIEGHICCTRITTDKNGNVKKKEAIDLDVSQYVMEGDKRKDHTYFRYALSTSRAKYIYHYLTDRGIDKSRVEYDGLGNSRPLIAEDIYDGK